MTGQKNLLVVGIQRKAAKKSVLLQCYINMSFFPPDNTQIPFSYTTTPCHRCYKWTTTKTKHAPIKAPWKKLNCAP